MYVFHSEYYLYPNCYFNIPLDKSVNLNLPITRKRVDIHTGEKNPSKSSASRGMSNQKLLWQILDDPCHPVVEISFLYWLNLATLIEYDGSNIMLTFKLHHFGHLVQRTDSLEKTLMLGKIADRGRRGRQRMRWLDGITNSTEMNLSKH